VSSFRSGLVLSGVFGFFLFPAGLTQAADPPPAKVRVLLLGDSTVIGTVPRQVAPKADHLEDIVRKLLAADTDLPPVEVLNQGRNGEQIHGLLTSRYDKDIAKLSALDFILIRYGINDRARRENFFTNFPQDYHKLVQRLRADHPKAQIVLETIIPYLDDQRDADANYLIHRVAEAEKLPLLDMHARFAAEMKKQGPNALTYRLLALKKVPQKYHALIPEGAVHFGNLIILDNRLDAHLGDVPGWFADRHPNLAGYHVIGDEIVRFLTPRLRVHGKASRKPGK
jgi:lysophospholipase L1-like esterase